MQRLVNTIYKFDSKEYISMDTYRFTTDLLVIFKGCATSHGCIDRLHDDDDDVCMSHTMCVCMCERACFMFLNS